MSACAYLCMFAGVSFQTLAVWLAVRCRFHDELSVYSMRLTLNSKLKICVFALEVRLPLVLIRYQSKQLQYESRWCSAKYVDECTLR